eukprot:357200-Chlamydomonas_euryale.AAC.1
MGLHMHCTSHSIWFTQYYSPHSVWFTLQFPQYYSHRHTLALHAQAAPLGRPGSRSGTGQTRGSRAPRASPRLGRPFPAPSAAPPWLAPAPHAVVE